MSLGETVVSRAELGALLDYSCSLPSGTTVGKRWRRNVHAFRHDRVGAPAEWVIGEYVDIGSGKVGIRWTWAVSAPGVPHRGDLREPIVTTEPEKD